MPVLFRLPAYATSPTGRKTEHYRMTCPRAISSWSARAFESALNGRGAGVPGDVAVGRFRLGHNGFDLIDSDAIGGELTPPLIMT